MNKAKHSKKHYFILSTKWLFWFTTGVSLGLFFFLSFIFIIFQKKYGNTIYPGVTINNINFGGQTKENVHAYFDNKNQSIEKSLITFTIGADTATISAQNLQLGYNSKLLEQQAYDIGRSTSIFSNVVLIFQAYLNTINLPVSYTYNQDAVLTLLEPNVKKYTIIPTDALFAFQTSNNQQFGKVTSFRPSSDGQEVDTKTAINKLISLIPQILNQNKTQNIIIVVPLKIVKPKISTNDANKFGIKELIGSGTSLFHHSIPGRIYNINLGSGKLNGVLIKPDEIFSFDNTIGDISEETGYKKAYTIQNGRTVLGDGGGVCQISTTLFRAVLNAGLPILERHAHAYRVSYYEAEDPPGFDATVFAPYVDFKFKNDTGNYILVQTIIDPVAQRLSFFLYGTYDGRIVNISKPTVSKLIPPPPDEYQDDPTLPKGTIQQVDFAAYGAHASFTREVTRDGKVLLADNFLSDYQPWQAIFLRGTKE